MHGRGSGSASVRRIQYVRNGFEGGGGGLPVSIHASEIDCGKTLIIVWEPGSRRGRWCGSDGPRFSRRGRPSSRVPDNRGKRRGRRVSGISPGADEVLRSTRFRDTW